MSRAAAGALLDLARAVDPACLMADLGFRPDAWQETVLRSPARRLLLLCARQLGKSTCTSILALHTALYQPGSLVLIVSPTFRQSSETYRKVTGFYADLGRPIPAHQETQQTLALANLSRVVCLPGEPRNLRGFSAPSLVIVDEAAQVDDELFPALSPMMATVPHARMVWLSTPFGARGTFWQQWESGGPEWERVRATAADCPRISPEFLASERRTLGERWFNQEYYCMFVEAIGQVFDSDSIASAFDTDEQPLFGAGAAFP